MRSAPAIVLEPARSRLHVAALLGAGALAVTGIALSAAAPWIQLALAGAAVLLVALAVRRLSATRPQRLVLGTDGRWSIRDARGAEVHGIEIQGRPFGPLIALTWREGRTRRDLLLFPDQLDVDTRRRLRAWLRHGRAEAESA